jgi:hypothetical protein
MPSRDEFLAWVEGFVVAFGLRFDNQYETMLAWYPVLARYRPEQLTRAVHTMLCSTVKFGDMSSIRVRLLELLREQDAVILVHTSRDLVGVCDTCQEHGWVPVPHPGSVANGAWRPILVAGATYYPTATVTCSCSKGRKVKQSCDQAVLEEKKGAKKPMTLEYYEQQICPQWREEFRCRREEKAAERALAAKEKECREGLKLKFDPRRIQNHESN